MTGENNLCFAFLAWALSHVYHQPLGRFRAGQQWLGTSLPHHTVTHPPADQGGLLPLITCSMRKQEGKSIGKVFVKLVSRLLLSHWLKQVTWPSPGRHREAWMSWSHIALNVNPKKGYEKWEETCKATTCLDFFSNCSTFINLIFNEDDLLNILLIYINLTELFCR